MLDSGLSDRDGSFTPALDLEQVGSRVKIRVSGSGVRVEGS